MKLIEFSDPHRRKHYEFFRQMDQPHFNITANVEITSLIRFLRQQHLPFSASVVYAIAHTANIIPAFRQRIRGEQVIEHNKVSPSFTVQTKASEVFSFCFVDYQPRYSQFVADAQEQIRQMQESPSFEDEAGRDDYLFLSSIPWIAFTGVQHAMHYTPVDSVPRITWGKYFDNGRQLVMPLSVQAHHALVDGRDMGRYFETIQELFLHPATW